MIIDLVTGSTYPTEAEYLELALGNAYWDDRYVAKLQRIENYNYAINHLGELTAIAYPTPTTETIDGVTRVKSLVWNDTLANNTLKYELSRVHYSDDPLTKAYNMIKYLELTITTI